MKKLLLLIFTAVLSLNLQAQSIDKTKSIVNFKIGNMKISSVKGTFTNMSGTINFEEADLKNSSFDVCVDASTVNTKNKNRDKTLTEAGFFDVEKYPKICFKSKDIYITPDGFAAKGKLSMHGVTKDEIISFSYKNNHFNGELEVSREAYKIGDSMGNFLISDTAKLEIDCFVK
ncbi:YceI family protein [Arcticibacterium luteifluviistationis]|uniref:Protein yceI n=1 Tax=Arcticibacterium luteifluviistationis TaxID=1784714 RepID=A0A2Z4GD31_9BACT|nr:YceI family protein [Arcticibacterium luteifluviistationis]AWV98813.1 protein yceI precursor [Arcticibacterium luteifluviistationis]